MAEGKKAFVVYTDWKKYIDDLNDAQIGKWTRWMFEYCNDKWKDKDNEIIYPKDRAVKMLCMVTKDILKRDLKKYEEKQQRLLKNGKQYQEKTDVETEIGTEIGIDVETEIEPVNSNKLLVNSNKLLPNKEKDTDKLINDKPCACTRESESFTNINLSPLTEEQREELKEAIDSKHLEYSEFLLLHKLIRPYYFNKTFNLEECIVLSDILKDMDSKYDRVVVAKGWSYSVDKSKGATNRIGYITSILEKNINNVIKNEDTKNETFDIKSLKKSLVNKK